MGNRNIWLSPTNQPSRLHLAYDRDYYLSIEPFIQLDTKNYKSFNIYITDDSKIKEGDWVLFKNNWIKKCNNEEEAEIYNNDDRIFKIILTDNKDLIKDGVQHIPDDFLEWFVKNPSCESVGIEPLMAGFVDDEPSYYENMYYIIIPQEEPKQKPCIQCDGTGETVFSGTYTTQRTCDVCNGKGYVSLDTIKQAEEDLKLIMSLQKPKQETLEERAWLTIFKEYTKNNESNLFMFFNWLERNYNPPEKIEL